MILLHRLSHLLYNDESLRPSDIIVITPSDSFNAFIDELSAILELEKVKTSTLNGYFLQLLKNAGVDIGARIDYAQPVPEQLLSYAYSEKFVLEIRKKLSKIFDGVHGMFSGEECREVAEGVASALEEQIKDYDFIKNAGLRVGEVFKAILRKNLPFGDRRLKTIV